MFYAAEGKHRVRASALAHLNPHLPFVPGFLVNFVLKVASPFGFKMMKKVGTLFLRHRFLGLYSCLTVQIGR